MRLAPDLYPLGSELPDLEELAPEELQYLCDVARLLAKLGICRGLSAPDSAQPADGARFDRDELGIDPEEDA